jgi:hypothetical protein
VLTFSAQPFHYDPSVGNLLLEITMPSTSPVSLFTDAYYESDNSGKLTSRYCDETECNENQSLVTEFDFASATVPEPSPLTLFFFGLVGLVSFRITLARNGRLRKHAVESEWSSLLPRAKRS